MGDRLRRNTILSVAGMWALVGVVHALARYADIVKYELDVQFTPGDVGYYVLSYSFWNVVTLALLVVLARHRRDTSIGRLVLIFLAGAAIWLPVYFALDYASATLRAGGGWRAWIDTYAATSSSVVFFYLVIYALTFALCLGLILARRARETEQYSLALEQQKAQAAVALAGQQMQLMQSQLSPHFLFNSLGAVSYLARSGDRDRLVAAVAKLGSLLRFTIDRAPQTLTALADELQFLDDYVGLQRLRFGARFQCTIQTDLDGGEQCPPFTLQPLLENVFRHEIEQLPDQSALGDTSPVVIKVTATSSDGRLSLSVHNTRLRHRERSGTPGSMGTGLQNLTARLDHVYGSAYTMNTNETNDAFHVELNLPARVADDEL